MVKTKRIIILPSWLSPGRPPAIPSPTSIKHQETFHDPDPRPWFPPPPLQAPEADIPVIRQMHRDGVAQAVIARQFGVKQPAIWFVVTRRSWGHIPDLGASSTSVPYAPALGGNRSFICSS